MSNRFVLDEGSTQEEQEAQEHDTALNVNVLEVQSNQDDTITRIDFASRTHRVAFDITQGDQEHERESNYHDSERYSTPPGEGMFLIVIITAISANRSNNYRNSNHKI